MNTPIPRRFRWTGLWLAGCLAALASTFAADASARRATFNIPAGDAADTLRRYGEQSGESIVYMVDEVRGRRTQPVSGQIVNSDALRQLLQGTNLEAIRDEASQAYHVGPKGPAADAPASGAASRAPAGSGVSEPAKPEVMELSPFQVSVATDKGYAATQSLGGSRVNLPIEDLAGSLITVTPKLISHVNPQEFTDVAKYVSGVNTATAKYGGQLTIRGYNVIGSGYRDGLPETTMLNGGGSNDLIGLDRIEVIKGPAGILYGASSMGGILNLVTRHPLPEFQANARVSLGSNEFKRAEVDATGPVNASKSLLFRFGAAWQDGNLPIGLPYDRQTFVPYLEHRFGNNSKLWGRFSYIRSLTSSDSGAWFTDVNGKFSTFLGQRAHTFESDEGRTIFFRNAEFGFSTSLQSGASTWDLRLVARTGNDSYAAVKYNILSFNMLNAAGALIGRLGTNAVASTDSFDNPALARIIATRNRTFQDTRLSEGLVNFDLAGKFELGPTRHLLLLNGSTSVTTSNTLTNAWDYPDIDVTNLTHFSGDPLARATNQRITAQSKANAHNASWGFQDNIYLLKDRLILVGGARYDWRQQNDTNIFLNRGGVEESVNQWTFKYGVVGKVRPGVTLFYNYSETFSPTIQRDPFTNARYPNLLGWIKEPGVKLELFNSRLIATASYFDMVLTNSIVSVYDPNGGAARPVPEGTAATKGWETDITAMPVKGLSIIVGLSDLTSKTDAGVRRRGVSQGLSYRFFTTYEFETGALKGLTFGGGYDFNNKRAGDVADTLKMPSYDLAEFMLSYQRKAWRVQLNVYNLFDEVFPFTSITRNWIFPSEPRSFRVSTSYSF
jgi:iron complex outermembrane receptor protein